MLLKVPFIWIGYLLIDRFVSFAFAGTSTIQLNMSHELCNVTASRERTISNNTVVIDLGDDMRLEFISRHYMNRIICNVSHPSNTPFDFKVKEIDPKLNPDNHKTKLEHIVITIKNEQAAEMESKQENNGTLKYLYAMKENVTKTYDGNWSCEILTLRDNQDVSHIVIVDNSTYRQTFCRARVHIQTPPPEPVTPNTKEDEKEEKFPDMYIYIIVGVVVAVIIITQTAVILYLKGKAKRTARLESLSLRAQDQDDSSKRYSSSPGVKISAFSRIMKRKSNRDDNNIYETLEEVRNAGDETPPVPPINTIPTLKRNRSFQNRSDSDAKESPRSLPRTKDRPTLNRISERETSPEPNISKRPPLPLPIHSHEADPSAHHQDRTSSYDDSGSLVGSLKRFRGERGASPAHLSKTPLQPIEEASQFKNSTLTRPRAGIGQASVTSELNNILKMRKASVGVPKNYNPPPPPKKHSIPSRIRKQYFGAADNSHQPEQKPFVAEAPNPLPTGKSAILLGLAPGPAPRQRLKPAPLNPPKTPNPVKPAPKIPNPPSKPVASGYKPPNPPLKPLSERATSPKPATAQKRLTNAPVKSFAPGKPIPVLPKTAPTTIGAPGTLKPVAHVPPVKPLKAQNPQPPKFENPGSQMHPHEMSKPLPPPPREVVEEPVYEEYDEEPYYNEEWTPPDPEPARFERPAPPNPEPPRFERPTTHFAPPVTSRPKPLPHRPPVQEEIYEEYPEEPVYNSDEEWTYEPLEKYNIYSS
ncbi:proteoglycan 4-like isoform X2 [Ostrinia nubilalis]|uniref:proteoglycan 4-like isoform X2 n=1 Tax=Ostrinia nubilalis TaxID=29057 RepID=UPI0030824E19